MINLTFQLQANSAMHLQHVARQVKKRCANSTEWPQNVNWNRELLSTLRHWTCLSNQRRLTIPSASKNKQKTEVSSPNAESNHTKAWCFKAIPSGVYKRLSITETNKNLPLEKSTHNTSKLFNAQIWSLKRSQHFLNNCDTMKKSRLLNKLSVIQTTNKAEGGQSISALLIPTAGLNPSSQSSKLSKTTDIQPPMVESAYVLPQIYRP